MRCSTLSACVALVLPLVLAAGAATAAPIIGGTTTKVGDFPNVVALEIGGALCTGTLITPEWVMTAAHCVSPSVLGVANQAAVTSSITVHFNTVSVFGAGGLRVKASDSIPDPGFDINNLGAHDMGLIKLVTPVTTITPTPVNLIAGRAPVGITVQMVGFGATGIVGGNPQVDGQERLVMQTSVGCGSLGAGNDANLLCFSQVAGKGKCEGDSGGPSFAMIDGVQTEVGVTSFGDQNCTAFGADTRTDAEKAFLMAHVGMAIACVKDGVCTAGCGAAGVPADPDCPVCTKDSECTTAGDICYGGKCILGPFTPMGIGSTCTANTDCQSGQCGTGPDGKKCIETCTVGGATACPSGFSCLGSTGAAGACWPDAGGGGGGCCDAGGSSAPTMLFGILLAGLAFVRRRG